MEKEKVSVSEGAEKPPMKESEMLDYLSEKYDFTPKGPEKYPYLTGKESHSYSPFIPKLPLFSGHDPVPKGEVSYTEWRFEVTCLLSDHVLPSGHMLQILRSSLRGTARKLLIPLGEGVSVIALLQKLDSTFGDLCPRNVTMQEFFDVQRPSESVTEYACRLESLLHAAMAGTPMDDTIKNDMLRHRFWTGLHSSKLRDCTRKDYDSITDYNALLRQVRIKEKEVLSADLTSSASKKVQHNPISTSADSGEFDRKLKDLEARFDVKLSSSLSSFQTRLDSMDSKFDQIMKRLDSSAQYQQSAQQSNSNHGNQGRWNGRRRRRSNWSRSNSQPQQGNSSTLQSKE